MAVFALRGTHHQRCLRCIVSKGLPELRNLVRFVRRDDVMRKRLLGFRILIGIDLIRLRGSGDHDFGGPLCTLFPLRSTITYRNTGNLAFIDDQVLRHDMSIRFDLHMKTDRG